MAEADLSPTTFTSRSASDPDYDISTEDSSENENENTYTEASSDNSSSDPETESNAKTEVRRSSTMPKPKPIWTGSSCHPQRTDQITENNFVVHNAQGSLDLLTSFSDLSTRRAQANSFCLLISSQEQDFAAIFIAISREAVNLRKPVVL